MIVVFFRKFSTILVILTGFLLSGNAANAQSGCPGTIPDCKTAQEMLSLAYVADLSSGLEGALGAITATTTKRISCLLPIASALGNNWTRIWGPTIVLKQKSGSGICGFLFPPSKQPTPANTLFVAKKNNENTYTVAVAGTNPTSGYGWCVEDADITPVAWPFGLHGGFVTQGTNDGLNILLGMRQATAPYTLVDLLTVIANIGQPATVYVAGHSLGGALAPALALWLKNHQRSWDPLGRVTLKIYAYAGATPGDKVFAAYINGQFTGSALNVINDTLDVVPHAWSITTLNQLDNLYNGAGVPPGFYIGLAIAAAKTNNQTTIQKFKKTHPTYPFAYGRTGAGSQQQPFSGKLIVPPSWPFTACPTLSEIEAIAKSKGLSKDDTNYALEAAYQHVCSYPDKLGIGGLSVKAENCRKANPVVGTYKP